MLTVQITNENKETKIFPMYISEWGSPEFTEEVAQAVHSFVGHDSAWHDMTYAMYDGGQSFFFFERNEHDNAIGYPEPSYSYQVLIGGKPCNNEELNRLYDENPVSMEDWYAFMSSNSENR